MGLAVTAAIALGGTAAASAATSAPAAPGFPGPGCNPWALEHWNLNGTNDVKAIYLGGTFNYSVTFKQTATEFRSEKFAPPSVDFQKP